MFIHSSSFGVFTFDCRCGGRLVSRNALLFLFRRRPCLISAPAGWSERPFGALQQSDSARRRFPRPSVVLFAIHSMQFSVLRGLRLLKQRPASPMDFRYSDGMADTAERSQQSCRRTS